MRFQPRLTTRDTALFDRCVLTEQFGLALCVILCLAIRSPTVIVPKIVSSYLNESIARIRATLAPEASVKFLPFPRPHAAVVDSPVIAPASSHDWLDNVDGCRDYRLA